MGIGTGLNEGYSEEIKAQKKRILEEDGNNPITNSNYFDEATSYKEAIIGKDLNAGLSESALLNAIAKNEGTYKTGYDTEYAYGKFGGRDKPLSEMSLNEVMKYQASMLDAQAGNKLRSTAIGRYQMLNQTLKDEIKYGKLTGDELFTPAMQDGLILQRLKRMRGYGDYKSGNLDKDAFVSNLSKEFASIVDPYTGKGTYGQGAKELSW